jgi:hypothetical protein
MGLFGITAHVGAVTYEAGTAVFYFEKGRTTWYAVVRGIPNFPEANIKACTWSGALDELGPHVVTNTTPNVSHPELHSLSVTVLALTKEKVFAYWVEDQALTWVKKLFG